MKYQSKSIVVLALLGLVSAEKLQGPYNGSKANFPGIPAYNSDISDRLYSDQLGNGDKKDDLQTENERDVDDDIVQDNGFGLQAKLFLNTQQQNMMTHRHQHKSHAHAHGVKYSDEIANGDKSDDKENIDDNDPTDPSVQDTGFGSDARLWTLAQKRHQHKSHAHGVKYSDELANGDKSDDKENIDDNDPVDPSVQDTGFGTDARLWTLAQKRHHHQKQHKSHAHAHGVKYSDELANGDKSDDKENIDDNDPVDPSVQDTGFGTDARLWTLAQKRHQHKSHAHAHGVKYSDELANGDKSDDKENIDDNDPVDPSVQDTGFGTDARLWTLAQRRHHNRPQSESFLQMSNQMKEKMIEIGAANQGNGDYDTLSNSDYNDNRQVEDENDEEDPLVQDSGFGTDAYLWHPTSFPDHKAIEKAFIAKNMVV